MSQRNLFETSTPHQAFHGARADDKQTSKDAANKLEASGALEGLKLGAFNACQVLGRSTANEIALEAAKMTDNLRKVESFRKRVRELVDMNRLRECEPRVCSETGSVATTYEVNK